MKFEDLDIKPFYDSRRSDVYNDFFNKVLSNSNFYRRFGGLFSAKRFALIAEGLQDFIKENNGTMELVMMPIISEEDREALLRGISVDDIIVKNWINDLSKIKEKFLEDHKMAISWMIANDYLTIKLILPEHENGIPFTESELKNVDVFRKEIGIFYNHDNHAPLSFHGQIDRDNPELGEFYSIDVSRSWVSSENETISSDHEEFTNYWDEKNYRIGSIKCKIRPLAEQLIHYFKEIAPKSKSEIPSLRKLPILRNYQNEAVSEWRKNGKRGIFEMATGTGKTFTAIGCIKKIETDEDKSLIIITAPYRNLLDQWKDELSKWFIDSTILEQGVWRQTLRDEISHLNRFVGKKISVLIASHDLFSIDYFVEQIEKSQVSNMIIVDEAHHLGSPKEREGLSKNYHYRLALSATIDRYFDGDGTDFLREYFKGSSEKSTVAFYSLEDAIRDGKLCNYNYYPLFVELNNNELDEYRILTYKAARLLNSKRIEDRKRGEELIMKRATIVRDAINKIGAFKEILKKIPKIKHMLIFCSENQFDDVDKILSNPSQYCEIDKSIMFRKITYDNPSNKKERIKILKEFADESWDVLTSNRVLDEGMDIPQARICVILASTGNPTQFIQRRGRVLRLYNDVYKDGTKKTHADIYDVLVRPQIEHFDDPDAIKLEIGIIKNQLIRIKTMTELAINREYCSEKLKEFTFNLPKEFFRNA